MKTNMRHQRSWQKKKDHFYQSDHNQGLNLFPNSIEQDGTQQSKE
jgi:hypothetical protein